ncbi:helix-turn-helix domain-containing protein [Brevibacterium casei]|uniref:helix-turn-helix domain-containing protein n=3 Tax=Brevibacterium casei TaxID=33889 RepID=UPI0034501780
MQIYRFSACRHIVYIVPLSIYAGLMTIGELQLTENERVGREVAAWMTRYNLRQADIAEILGFAQRNVSKRIRGEMPFRIDELLAIARYMGISLSQLLGEGIVNEKNPQPVELTEGSATLVAGGGFEPPTSGL